MKKRILFLMLLFISLTIIPVYAEGEPININNEEITVESVKNQVYTGYSIEPKAVILHNEKVLEENTDYILEYTDNINSGIATITIIGQGDYVGTRNITFNIDQKSVSNLKIENLKNYTFSNKNYTQNLKITYNDFQLVNNQDYTLEYKNNRNAGTATVIIKGIGNYSGSKSLNFKIYKRKLSTVSISTVSSKPYTGSYIKPTLTLKYNGNTLTKGVSYKLGYKNNKNIGLATITITGIGNYTGTRTRTFKIIPRKTTISTASFSGKKITLKWNKVKNATGYKIYMAKGKNSYSLYKTIIGNTKLKYTTGNLSRGTTYHFYIKSYKKVNGKFYFSNKSNEKTIRIPTIAELNAKKMAKDYLKILAFSRLGLIDQLEYEGFTHSQAVYGTDHAGANWYTQAVRSAKSYLEIMAFSREGLIEQLEYEKFTHEQAVYAANKVGL